VYTFGRDPSLNPADFRASGLSAGAVFVRRPGSVRGQQFVIEDCTDCDIYVLDHSAAVNIDACVGCRIVLGPCESSVFVRDCRGCSLVLAAQQLRTRDCHDCQLLLHCSTQPIIESSSGLQLGCYAYHYPELRAQFEAARLPCWTNRWSDVHDFTPPEHGGGGGGADRHWAWLPRMRTAPQQLVPPIAPPPPVVAAAACGAGGAVAEGEVEESLLSVEVSLLSSAEAQDDADDADDADDDGGGGGGGSGGGVAAASKDAGKDAPAADAPVVVAEDAQAAAAAAGVPEPAAALALPLVVPPTTGARPELSALACCFVCVPRAPTWEAGPLERLVEDVTGAGGGEGGERGEGVAAGAGAAEAGEAVHLVRTRGFELSAEQAMALAPGRELAAGACVGLEFRGGTGVIEQVGGALARLGLAPSARYCPADPAVAKESARLFFETWEVEI